MEHIRVAEAGIPEHYWIDLPAKMMDEYQEMLRQIRLELTAADVYDPRMMKLMFRLRCRANPSHFECAEKAEG